MGAKAIHIWRQNPNPVGEILWLVLSQDIAAMLISVEGGVGLGLVPAKDVMAALFTGIGYNYLKASAGAAPTDVKAVGNGANL